MKSEKAMQDRVILHSDFNCFYASAETALHPEYRGQPIAVCGSTEERHGIVLAKSEPAKRAGVKTGMTNAEAMSLCPGFSSFRRILRFTRNSPAWRGRSTRAIPI